MKTHTILGGGIAGLTAAIALRKKGVRAEVFESAPQIRALGAGLMLAANAVKGYQKLGISEQIITKGHFLPAFSILDRGGRVITHADANAIGRKYGIHNFAIHRADLHNALLAELEPDQIHTGKHAVKVVKNGTGTTVFFRDGSTHDTDCLIVADGIHSPIRRQLLPDSEPRYAGYTCWRAVIDNPGLNLTRASETWGTEGRFGIVPLAKGRIYWFACVNASQDDPAMQNMNIEGLARIFGRFHEPVPVILQHTSDQDLIWNDIIDLKPQPQFAFGNIVLIGDAAHATTPNMGQGACQAVEDAVILADELGRHSSPETAFAVFEKRRMKRTHYIVNNSWSLGKMAQSDNRLLAGLRNFLLRLIPEWINERQLKALLEVDF